MPGSQPTGSESRSSHERRLSSPCCKALGSPSPASTGEGEEPRSLFLSFPLARLCTVLRAQVGGLLAGDSTADLCSTGRAGLAPAPLCGRLRDQTGCPVLLLRMKERMAEYEHLHFCQSLWTPAVKQYLETSIQLELGRPERTQDRPSLAANTTALFILPWLCWAWTSKAVFLLQSQVAWAAIHHRQPQFQTT